MASMIRTLALGAGLSTFASAALAQPLYVARGPRYERPPAPYTQRSPYETVVCQRWCDADSLPCDPASFKIADGRCASRTRF